MVEPLRYRKKPVVIEAQQWFWRTHEHEQVLPFWTDKWVVNKCPQCGGKAEQHGRVPTLEGEHIVCPGDWIIRGVKGEFYPVKPEIFAATYEPAPESGATSQTEHDFLRSLLEAEESPHVLAERVIQAGFTRQRKAAVGLAALLHAAELRGAVKGLEEAIKLVEDNADRWTTTASVTGLTSPEIGRVLDAIRTAAGRAP